MSWFEVLCNKYNDKRVRDIDFATEAGIRAKQFAEQFQRYIQAPLSCTFTDDSGKICWKDCIELVFADTNWHETGKDHLSVSDISFDSKGFLRFYLLILLGRDGNSYTKALYQINCGVRPLDDKQCRVFVERPEDSIYKEFIWTFDPELSDTGPLQHIVDLLIQQLDRQPFLNTPLAE